MKEEARLILEKACRAWLDENSPGREGDAPYVSVEIPPDAIAADLSSNWPLGAAKKFGKQPRALAQDIAARLEGLDPVGRAEPAGPGFVNIFLSDKWLLEELRAMLRKRDLYARRAPAGETVLVEFVSANPNGPLHVGHGRGAALGDALARILRHLGYEVTTEYYINDAGNQMDNLGASLMWRCGEIQPDYLDPSEKAVLAAKKPEDLYKGDYIVLVARNLVAEFPRGSARPQGIEFFRRKGIDAILGLIREDLKIFNVRMDSWFPESSLHSEGWVDKALGILREKGHTVEENGALWFRSTVFGDDKDRVLKRSDERPTYFAADVAYHNYKFQRGFKKMIDIWGTDHHGYVQRLKASVKALGHDAEALTILLYQLVTLMRGGKPVAMSTRTGEFVTLREVVDEVGRDAARFFFAMLSPQTHLKFDLDLAKKKAAENPVFSVQYVHARACSLFKEAAKRGVSTENLDSFPPPARLENQERALLVRLASFPDVLEQCRRDMSPHPLASFLRDVSGDYHRFYENCPVLGDSPDATVFRLALVDGVRALVRSGLSLLGVSAPEEM